MEVSPWWQRIVALALGVVAAWSLAQPSERPPVPSPRAMDEDVTAPALVDRGLDVSMEEGLAFLALVKRASSPAHAVSAMLHPHEFEYAVSREVARAQLQHMGLPVPSV